MKKYVISFFIVLQYLCLYSQIENKEYGLLWEISGNDFEKPSYIFGSAHLNDAQLFSFPDSLIHFLKSADAFANEIQLDSFANSILNTFSEDPDAFMGNNSDSDNGDSFESFFLDGKPTFIDAYLYRIAKNLNKELFGLEPEQNQLSGLDFLKEDPMNKKEFFQSDDYQTLVTLYRKGNLKDLNDYIQGFGEIFPDSLSNKRNQDMAETIIKIGKKKSLFSVVGLMHLIEPGNVLSLLKESGYTLRKVGPISKMVSLDSYYYDRPDDEWPLQNVDDKYEFLHPGNTVHVNLEEFIDVHFTFDVSLGLLFMNFFMDLGSPDSDAFFEQMLISFKEENDEIVFDELTETDTSRVRLVKLRSDDVAKDIRFLYQNNRYAMQVIFGFSKSALEQKEVQKYFNGTRIIKQKHNWQSYNSVRASCVYSFPVQVAFSHNKIKVKSNSVEGFQNIYYKTYTDDENSFVFRFNDQIPGIQINNCRNKLDIIKSFIENQYSANCIDSTYSNFDSYSSLNAEFINYDTGVKVYLLSVIRGNRVYMLIHQSLKGIRNDAFFDGFSFLPFNSNGLVKVKDDDYNISFNFSEEFIKHDTSLLLFNKRRYYGRDTINSTTLFLSIIDYNPYYFSTTFDSILESDMNNTVLETDSLISFSIEKADSHGKKYFIKKQRMTGDGIQFLGGLYQNKRVIELSISYPKEMAGQEYGEKLFASIESNQKTSGLQFWQDGTSFLYEGLLSEDSLTYHQAYTFLDWKSISDEDIESIVEVLKMPLPTNHPNPNLKLDLIDQLSYAGESKILPRLKYLFSSNTDTLLNQKILEYFCSLNSEKGLKTFFELQNVEEPLFSDAMLNPFYDSLELFVAYYDNLKTLVSKSDKFYDDFLLIYAYVMQENGLDSTVLLKDSLWVKEQLMESLYLFKQEYVKDSSYYFPIFFFPHLEYMPINSFVLTALDSCKSVTKSFGEYSLLAFQFDREIDVSEDILLRCIEKEGYRYELLYLLQSYDAFYMVPDTFKSIEFISVAMVRYYYYENEGIWAEKAIVGKPFLHTKNETDFYLVPVRIKFKYLNSDYEFLTFAGPFSDLNKPTQFKDNYMVYLNNQIDENYDSIAKELLDYIDNKLE
jgi:uncharacterized protein YbaP (TraB family)